MVNITQKENLYIIGNHRADFMKEHIELFTKEPTNQFRVGSVKKNPERSSKKRYTIGLIPMMDSQPSMNPAFSSSSYTNAISPKFIQRTAQSVHKYQESVNLIPKNAPRKSSNLLSISDLEKLKQREKSTKIMRKDGERSTSKLSSASNKSAVFRISSNFGKSPIMRSPMSNGESSVKSGFNKRYSQIVSAALKSENSQLMHILNSTSHQVKANRLNLLSIEKEKFNGLVTRKIDPSNIKQSSSVRDIKYC